VTKATRHPKWFIVALIVMGPLLFVGVLFMKLNIPIRLAFIDGSLEVERCSYGDPFERGETFSCNTGADYLTQSNIDENADGEADLRTFLWDGTKPRRCETQFDGKWIEIGLAECCRRAGCEESVTRALLDGGI
jgi:hypothetical protein